MSAFALSTTGFQEVSETLFLWALKLAESVQHVYRVYYPNGVEYYWDKQQQGRVVLGREIDGKHFLPSK